VRLAFNGWGGSLGTVLPEAIEVARKAVALDHDDPWAYLALGWIETFMRRPAEAIVVLSKAIELNPNFALGYACLGWALSSAGKSEAAIQKLDRAIRMSPHDSFKHGYFQFYAIAHGSAGRYREAADWAWKAIQERPDMVTTHRAFVANCALAGEIDRARTALIELRRLHPDI
jgi:tetratricopeptide (TPR) repeat protein